MPSHREAFVRHAAQALHEAETRLPRDVTRALANAAKAESNDRAKGQICAILENVRLAGAAGLPMCQDTGVPIFFVEIGREANIDFDLKKALATAVQRATDAVPLRQHAVGPLTRMSCDEPLFDMICDISEGNRLSTAVLVKGAGSENVSALAMLEPLQDVRPFVLSTIWKSGGKPCPPIIVGLGI
jgi:fumarate hydratase subunit alpha